MIPFMKKLRWITPRFDTSLCLFSALACLATAEEIQPTLRDKKGTWRLTWSDEFNGTDAQLDAQWQSQNGPSGHILCSRWRENALVSAGTLKLLNKKQKRGGQEWTSGNIWTKKQFQYGYFECRYRYAAATGTNNSFWLMTTNKQAPARGKSFEIDINEGHFPCEVNTNIHNWTDVTIVDGKRKHPSSSKSFHFGSEPSVSLSLEIPIQTRRLRLSTAQTGQVRLSEFRAFNVHPAGYPDALRPRANSSPGLINYACEKTTIARSSNPPNASDAALIDGKIDTAWISQSKGEKFIEITFAEPRTLGCIQFISGSGTSAGTIKNGLDQYQLSYEKEGKWVELSRRDASNPPQNFARDYQTYGLEWTEKHLIFYFNGQEIRREPNRFCFSPAPIWLSLAIIPWGGAITDAIDGTQMEVDYVRVFQRQP